MPARRTRHRRKRYVRRAIKSRKIRKTRRRRRMRRRWRGGENLPTTAPQVSAGNAASNVGQQAKGLWTRLSSAVGSLKNTVKRKLSSSQSTTAEENQV